MAHDRGLRRKISTKGVRQKRGGEVSFGAELKIDRLGHRGEGIADFHGGSVFVPHALPGETVRADVDGERAASCEVLIASPHRVDPVCRHYGECGGCALQVCETQAYRDWKRSLVEDALGRARIDVPVAPLRPAHGEGRRRVTLHARVEESGRGGATVRVGFMRARSHAIVDIDRCPLLSPALSVAPQVARAIAEALAELRKPLDIMLTETLGGIDVDVRGCGPLPGELRLRLCDLAGRLGLARIANHGDIVIELVPPLLSVGAAHVAPPPGSFLQATLAGEDMLAGLVLEAATGSKQIAELFAGIGTFTLRLASIAPVLAVEFEAPALRALERAARASVELKPVSTQQRDLFRRPLLAAELNAFDCVVFDPPRAGAEAQARELALSDVPCVIAVSCNVTTFARDVRLLLDGGYALQAVTPVDQFLYSPHVEIVGVFGRAAAPKKRRRLLG